MYYARMQLCTYINLPFWQRWLMNSEVMLLINAFIERSKIILHTSNLQLKRVQGIAKSTR